LEQHDRGATVVISTHRMEQVEALCDAICLIHQGRPVLEGNLAAIKAGYGRNTIAVEYHGSRGTLGALAGIRRCEDTGHEARLELEPDTDPQTVMRAVLVRVAIQSIKLDHSHIEEIYLATVGHRDASPEGATR
jgi:ABC-2 type transport system ATP-binding protein